MGGQNGVFRTTAWADIGAARSEDESRKIQILDNLLARYWKPVYCYLRRKGFGNEEVKDLTQGFFHEVVLGRDLIQRSEPDKGRFRTFLLTALDRYVINVHSRQTARKRSPISGTVSLELGELSNLEEGQKQASPEQMFQYAWAASLLDQVLAKTKKECYATGKDVHWEVFREKVLGPIFEGSQPPPLEELCTKHNIVTEATVSNMIVTAKRMFRRTLEKTLRELVPSEDLVKNELAELFAILSDGRAR